MTKETSTIPAVAALQNAVAQYQDVGNRIEECGRMKCTLEQENARLMKSGDVSDRVVTAIATNKIKLDILPHRIEQLYGEQEAVLGPISQALGPARGELFTRLGKIRGNLLAKIRASLSDFVATGEKLDMILDQVFEQTDEFVALKEIRDYTYQNQDFREQADNILQAFALLSAFEKKYPALADYTAISPDATNATPAAAPSKAWHFQRALPLGLIISLIS